MPSLSLYFLLVTAAFSRSLRPHESHTPSWPIPSFLQLRFDLGGMATLGAALLPPQLAGLAGPVVAVATAKANAKKGISKVFNGGEDYPWVCSCTPFEMHKRTVNTPRTCPYAADMGCFTDPSPPPSR